MCERCSHFGAGGDESSILLSTSNPAKQTRPFAHPVWGAARSANVLVFPRTIGSTLVSNTYLKIMHLDGGDRG